MSEKDFDEDLDDLGAAKPEGAASPAIASKTPAKAAQPIASKTPAQKPAGDDISLYFQSTVGPGEKKQKLLVNTGNKVGAIKNTVGNIFGLNPEDFHLSAGGVTLDENDPLSNYKVKDGDTVLLIPASTAGR